MQIPCIYSTEMWSLIPSPWMSTCLSVLMTSDTVGLPELDDKKPWHFCPRLLEYSLLEPRHHAARNLSYMERPHIDAPVSVSALIELLATTTSHVSKPSWMSKPGEPSKTLTSASIWWQYKRSHGGTNQHELSQPTELQEIIRNFCFKPLNLGVVLPCNNKILI